MAAMSSGRRSNACGPTPHCAPEVTRKLARSAGCAALILGEASVEITPVAAHISRRHLIRVAFAAAGAGAAADWASAQSAQLPFGQWLAAFAGRARARGVS